MKIYIILLLICFPILIKAQDKEFPVCLNRTTALLFKNDILHSDLGTDYGIGFQIDDTLPNILKIRINNHFDSIKETSLIVITRNGYVFSFLLRKKNELIKNVYQINDSIADNYEVLNLLHEDTADDNSQNLYELLIASNEYLPRILCCKKGKVSLLLNKIHTDSQRLYFCCEICNNSALKYNVGFCNLFVATQKKIKATSRQELPVNFSFIGPKLKSVPAHSLIKFILSVPKFTMEKGQICILEIYEQNGGRHFQLKISNSTLLATHIIK